MQVKNKSKVQNTVWGGRKLSYCETHPIDREEVGNRLVRKQV